MTGEALLFIFAVIAAAVLLFIMVYFIIMFSDLEIDYINPIDLCNKLNMVFVCDQCMVRCTCPPLQVISRRSLAAESLCLTHLYFQS